MNESVDYRPMIEPDYVDWPSYKQIPLVGRILAFGSGQLLHEQKLFDLSGIERLIAYDPFVALNPDRLFPGLADRTIYRQNWTDASQEGPFDHILCLFSLHYEPRWLVTLLEILECLEPGGRLFFCEDAGFRAILDGSPKNLHEIAAIQEAFHERLMRDIAAPWLPDLSASDASLLQEVLVLFGETKELDTVRVKRTACPAAEPDCYLPWNRDRNDIPGDLIEKVRSAIEAQESIEETIKLYEFTRDPVPRPCDVFDLADPRARLAWRAVGDRAARALGRLIVSRTGSRPTENDLPFRKAALALLYQNILRHFSFWRGAELVVGALNPEFEKNLTSDLAQYEFTCIAPNETPRFWGARFDPPSFLLDYRNGIQASGQGWVGKTLYECARGGVYCWPGTNGSLGDDKTWHVIGRNDPLQSAFAERETPPCVYIVDPLATRDRFVVSPDNHFLYGALIIYLREHPPYPVEAELRCLLFVLENSRAIVVGRAGFLELELLQEDARNSEAIQEPLRKLREHQHALRETSDAVELLAQRLDPTFESPGLPFLERLGRAFVDAALFEAELHDPESHNSAGLIPVVFSEPVQSYMRGIAQELEKHGIRRETTEKLFRPLSADRLVDHAVGAAAFAKTLAESNALPLVWIRAASGLDEQDDDCRMYVPIVPVEPNLALGLKVDPISVFIAFYNARLASENVDVEIKDNTLRCTWIIRPDSRGSEGIDKLTHLLNRSSGVQGQSSGHLGLTTRSFLRLKALADAANFTLIQSGGNLTVECIFEWVRS